MNDGDILQKERYKGIVVRLRSPLSEGDIFDKGRYEGIVAHDIRRTPAADRSRKDRNAVIALNLNAVFILSRLAGKHMIEHGNGKSLILLAIAAFPRQIRLDPKGALSR